MPDIKNSKSTISVITKTIRIAQDYRHEFFMPEHMLLALLDEQPFTEAVEYFDDEAKDHLGNNLRNYLGELESVPQGMDYTLETSAQMQHLMNTAAAQVVSSSAEMLDVPHLVRAMLMLEDSQARYLLETTVGGETEEFMSVLISVYEQVNAEQDADAPRQEEAWRSQVVCLNDLVGRQNPLIGRQEELERTIQVLWERLLWCMDSQPVLWLAMCPHV